MNTAATTEGVLATVDSDDIDSIHSDDSSIMEIETVKQKQMQKETQNEDKKLTQEEALEELLELIKISITYQQHLRSQRSPSPQQLQQLQLNYIGNEHEHLTFCPRRAPVYLLVIVHLLFLSSRNAS